MFFLFQLGSIFNQPCGRNLRLVASMAKSSTACWSQWLQRTREHQKEALPFQQRDITKLGLEQSKGFMEGLVQQVFEGACSPCPSECFRPSKTSRLQILQVDRLQRSLLLTLPSFPFSLRFGEICVLSNVAKSPVLKVHRCLRFRLGPRPQSFLERQARPDVRGARVARGALSIQHWCWFHILVYAWLVHTASFRCSGRMHEQHETGPKAFQN